MARGATVTSPPAGSSLPKVEFEVIEDEDLKLPGGVYESQPISFGCTCFGLLGRFCGLVDIMYSQRYCSRFLPA